ncbi:MAG: hypothetical protein IKQ91_11090 [Oscillospiraceae bacterium]|nr:hypothetical protein [Oscillospiraceae bacterium]
MGEEEKDAGEIIMGGKTEAGTAGLYRKTQVNLLVNAIRIDPTIQNLSLTRDTLSIPAKIKSEKRIRFPDCLNHFVL